MSDIIIEIAEAIGQINRALTDRGMRPISSIRLANDGAQIFAFGHAVNESLLNHHQRKDVTMAYARGVKIADVIITEEV